MSKDVETIDELLETANEAEVFPEKNRLLDATSGIPVVQQLGILAMILLLIFGTGYVPKFLNSLEESRRDATASVPATVAANEADDEKVDYFADLNIRAESAYVWDVAEQRVLFQKNPDKQLPLASITKLMTALVAYELMEDEADVPVTVSALLQDGDSGLLAGESFALLDLLNLTLMSSSNDGAYAIAAAVGAELETEGDASTFVRAMNIRASELGLTQTYYKNPTGLDISKEEGGAYGSARDTTFLMEYILRQYPEILEQTQEDFARIYNESGNTHNVDNTNPTVGKIDGLIGSKTGYTELAGGNLGIAFDAAMNRPIIVVVLNSSRNGRFEDVLSLSNSARQAIQ